MEITPWLVYIHRAYVEAEARKAFSSQFAYSFETICENPESCRSKGGLEGAQSQGFN